MFIVIRDSKNLGSKKNNHRLEKLESPAVYPYDLRLVQVVQPPHLPLRNCRRIHC